MPKGVEEVAVLFGAALRAPDERSLGRLSELGLDHFGHLSALVGPSGAGKDTLIFSGRKATDLLTAS